MHFPILVAPLISQDTRYAPGEDGFAEWMTKRWGSRFPRLVSWFEEYLGQCQVANVPVGSVPANTQISSYLWDVMFARRLREAKQILWATQVQHYVSFEFSVIIAAAT